MSVAEPRAARTAAAGKPVPAWRCTIDSGPLSLGGILLFAFPVVVSGLGLGAAGIESPSS